MAEMLTLWWTEKKRKHGHIHDHITSIDPQFPPPAHLLCPLSSSPPYSSNHPRKKLCEWVVKESIHHGRNVPFFRATGHRREDIMC